MIERNKERGRPRSLLRPLAGWLLRARARVGDGASERGNEQRFKSFMTVAAVARVARDSGIVTHPYCNQPIYHRPGQDSVKKPSVLGPG